MSLNAMPVHRAVSSPSRRAASQNVLVIMAKFPSIRVWERRCSFAPVLLPDQPKLSAIQA
jgi:hypothetical protein